VQTIVSDLGKEPYGELEYHLVAWNSTNRAGKSRGDLMRFFGGTHKKKNGAGFDDRSFPMSGVRKGPAKT